MKILVCGGRNFGDLSIPREDPRWGARRKEYQFIHTEIQRYIESFGQLYTTEGCPNDNYLYKNVMIINGGAHGADKASTDWAVCAYVPFNEYPADWKKHGKAAGPIRNQQMIDIGKPNVVIAFPGGSGTADMVNRAKKANIKVIEVKYDDSSND